MFTFWNHPVSFAVR